MEFLRVVLDNVISPPILFFILGILIGVLKTDFSFSEGIKRFLSIYLMIAIGFKGGVALSNIEALEFQTILVILMGLAFGVLQPFLGYILLRLTSRLDAITAAAVAAHYGSVSILTFAIATTFLKTNNISYMGYIIAILALMETPAIFSGLFLAHKHQKSILNRKNAFQESLVNGPILLLLGSFMIGALTGKAGMEKLDGFLISPFQGVLCLFLLEIGLSVSSNFHQLKQFTLPLILYSFYMPLIGGGFGLLISYMIALDLGTGLLFSVLCASASYIAVPAAMRLALPEAKAAIYVPMTLALTFPFNITLGIPLYYEIAKKLL